MSRFRARLSSTGASTLTIAALIAGAALPACAQDGSDEIVVSAQRRDERLQDVPVAVSAFSEARLEELQANDIGDLRGSVPNFEVHVGDAQNAVVYIRGVGQIDSLAFNDPGVGIYVDDVYLGRAQGAFLDIYDVSRIEVLRGPQGTLYGRNTIGGAVKFVSAPMSEELSARAEVTAGDYDRLDVKAQVGSALTDKLLFKASFARLARDGYAINEATGEDDGDKDTLAGRLAFEYRANEDLTLMLSADVSRDRPDTSRTPARATPVFGLVPPNDDPFVIAADFNDQNDLTTFGASLVADWRVSDDITLKSISAGRRLIYETKLDLDATSFGFFGIYDQERQKQFSQELQMLHDGERLDFVAGLYYFYEYDRTYAGVFGPDIAFIDGELNLQTNKSYAAYGQADYALTDRLTATAGLRFTYEEKDFSRVVRLFPDPATPFPVDFEGPGGLEITNVDVSDDWSALTPKVGLDYRWTDDVLIYASVSRGFKSGGFDGRSRDAFTARPYEPEFLWAYEAGLKSTLFDGLATANVAFFYNDYTDLQLSTFGRAEDGSFAALFGNAGKATMKGVEVELAAHPLPGLRLDVSAGYLDGEYDEYIGPGGADISDQRFLVNAPEWTGRAGGSYRFDLGSAGGVTLGGDLTWRSKTYTTVSSSEFLAQDAFALGNAFIRWDHPDERVYVQAGVKNIGDTRYIEHGFDLSDSLGYQLAYYGDPRTWSVTVGFKY